jgi:uncharacterized protein GlcG (DUF336 family)
MSTLTDTRQSILLDDARRIIAAGESTARAADLSMHLTVVDGWGDLVAHARMDGEWFREIAGRLNGPLSGRAFEMARGVLASEMPDARHFVTIDRTDGSRLTVFLGGAPLTRDDEVVGAVGVCGMAGEADGTVPTAAADAL